MLSNSFEEENFKLTFPKFTSPKAAKQIVKPANHEQIIEEINFLKEGDYQLLQSKNYKVFLVTAEKIPNILHEIGRLREITFREVGEGTNEAIDSIHLILLHVQVFNHALDHALLHDGAAARRPSGAWSLLGADQ